MLNKMYNLESVIAKIADLFVVVVVSFPLLVVFLKIQKVFKLQDKKTQTPLKKIK